MTDIAVIGMACRFPGAADLESFWRNLVDGRDTISRRPAQPVPGGRGEYVPARGLLDQPEWFDAGYFGYSPREARLISPQHRVLLECALEAMEHAGHDPERHPGTIGVYAGGTETAYGQLLRSERHQLPNVSDWEVLIGTATDFLVSRIAYKLGLRGPAITVQAACATSLVGVHLACQGLLSGDCDLALAGGAAVHAPAKESIYSEGGILSADGVCRTFDAAAGGTVGADGAGLLVLKRLPEALADGDHVYAVIRGSAVNNDGADRIGFTAPSVDGQAAAVRDAQLIADVDADTIGYVEAHGTATPLGDPIELTALTTAFRGDTDRRGHCWIGSVKTNIGHTDAAAGAAGLIKTVLALDRGLIPASLHFSEPNPGLNLAQTPFRVVTEPQPWPAGASAEPRRAGVSAFGIGGTNSHVVLEEAPEPELTGLAQPWQLLPLSAKTPAALDAVTARLAAHLAGHPEQEIADVAWTLQAGRRELPYRRYALVTGRPDAIAVLTGADDSRLITGGEPPHDRPAAFVLRGGPVDPGEVGRLYRSETPFRRAFDEVLDCLDDSLVTQLHAAVRHGTAVTDPLAARLIAFATETGLARLWTSWGVSPTGLYGTGFGLFTASLLADVFDLPQAVRLLLEVPLDGPSPELEAADLIQDAAGRHAQIPLSCDPDGDRPQDDSGRILVELTTLRSDAESIAAVAITEGGAPATLAALGRSWLAGTQICWPAVHSGRRRARVPLPSYPFERQRYLVDPEQADPAQPVQPVRLVQPVQPVQPSPSSQSEPSAQPGERPVGDALAVVLGWFAETLELPDVEPDDSFFDLGGDSLIAVRLLAQVRQTYPVQVDVGTLFDAPTPAEFAAVLDQALADALDAALAEH